MLRLTALAALVSSICASGNGGGTILRSRPPVHPPSNGTGTATVAPAPLVSVGKRSVSKPSGCDRALDTKPGNGSWEAKLPTPSSPAACTIDVGRGPTRLLLSWAASGNPNYEETTYGGPGSYRIETAADSKDGKTGAWHTVVVVNDNQVMNRAHAFDFEGMRWVRLVITGPGPQTNQYGVQLDTIRVHDVTRGGRDSWIFLGDSITAEVYRGSQFQPTFAMRVAAAAPGYAPVSLVAGIPFYKSGDVLAKLPTWLQWNQDITHWAIGIGSNNPVDQPSQISDYQRDLEAIVTLLLGAGKVPVLARVPWQAGRDMAPLNAALDAVVQKHRLRPGPDFYAHFKAHPEQLRDGLHPDEDGAREMHRLWAEAMRDLYP